MCKWSVHALEENVPKRLGLAEVQFLLAQLRILQLGHPVQVNGFTQYIIKAPFVQ